MRVECGSCKKLSEARFEQDLDGTVVVTCATCGKPTAAPLGDKRIKSTTIPIDKLCPKCGATRKPDAEACAACGIATSRMAAYAEERDAAVPDEVHAAWKVVQASWADPARHDELLLLVSRHNCYAWAAGRYRDKARSRPHDPIAARQLERLRRAGEATLFATASARPERKAGSYAGVIAVLGVLLLALVGGVIYALTRHNDAPLPSSTVQVR